MILLYHTCAHSAWVAYLLSFELQAIQHYTVANALHRTPRAIASQWAALTMAQNGANPQLHTIKPFPPLLLDPRASHPQTLRPHPLTAHIMPAMALEVLITTSHPSQSSSSLSSPSSPSPSRPLSIPSAHTSHRWSLRSPMSSKGKLDYMLGLWHLRLRLPNSRQAFSGDGSRIG